MLSLLAATLLAAFCHAPVAAQPDQPPGDFNPMPLGPGLLPFLSDASLPSHDSAAAPAPGDLPPLDIASTTEDASSTGNPTGVVLMRLRGSSVRTRRVRPRHRSGCDDSQSSQLAKHLPDNESGPGEASYFNLVDSATHIAFICDHVRGAVACQSAVRPSGSAISVFSTADACHAARFPACPRISGGTFRNWYAGGTDGFTGAGFNQWYALMSPHHLWRFYVMSVRLCMLIVRDLHRHHPSTRFPQGLAGAAAGAAPVDDPSSGV